MKPLWKWILSIVTIALIVSVYFNYAQYKSNEWLKSLGRQDLIVGLAMIQQGNHDILSGESSVALVNQGIGRLSASSQVLPIHGIQGLCDYFTMSFNSMVSSSHPMSDSDKKHFEHVLTVAQSAFHPFGSIDYRYMSDKSLQQALNSVFDSMTQAERQRFDY